jgi:endonuclease III
MDQREELVRRLLEVAGTTYAAEAGVKINDKPMPLFQLLVLCMLASKPIDAAIAVGAARELFKAGLRSPKAVLASDRRTMISAFGRAHYVRYDESSATRLTDMAERVRDDYSGDLREIAKRSRHDVAAAKRMLKRFKGIGDTGADIYLREVQDVWPWARPQLRRPRHRGGQATGSARSAGQAGSPCSAGQRAAGGRARQGIIGRRRAPAGVRLIRH